jgi:hypothetical protein
LLEATATLWISASGTTVSGSDVSMVIVYVYVYIYIVWYSIADLEQHCIAPNLFG